MSQAPRRQGSPPLEGMYVVSPASTLSFSDGVNQHLFCWHHRSRDSFHQMSLWLCFFLPSYKNSVCKWDAVLNVLHKKDTAMHPCAFCFYPVKCFTILKKNLWAEAPVLRYWRVVFTPFIPFTVRFPCSEHETCIHRHSRPSFNPIKNQQQYFMEFQTLCTSSRS